MNQSQSFLKYSQQIILQWKDLSLIDKKTDKYVLNHLSGQVESGQFLTIMGPSGAGKSSFLSLLTAKTSAYVSTFNFEGQTTLNGSKYTQEKFISIASYVPQDDLLMETLTVQQTFAFQANLKLSDLTQTQRADRVKQVLMLLNLYEIRNSKVGGRLTKSISGGQKKRVAIGVQLISNPMILVLDEPTSGLDSFNSLKIINILSNLAKKQNKIIIATIHQPSTLMFQKFDKLMVLKNGQEVYNDYACNMVKYMQKMQIKVDYRMNPADFFMLQLSQFKESQGHKTPMTSWAWQKWNQIQTANINATQIEQELYKIDFNLHPPTPLTQQFKPLMSRSFKSYIRTPTNQFGKLMQMIWYPLLIGVLFFDVIDRFPADLQDQEKLLSFLKQFTGFLYLGMFFTVTIPLYDMILVFPIEKQLVLKEVRSNMYSLELYFGIKLLIQVPSVLISTWITTTIVFFIVGLEPTFSNWFMYELGFSIIAFVGYLIGLIMGVLAKQPHYAVQAAPFIVTVMTLYGGCVVNLRAIPAYSGWIQYLSPLSYGYNVLIKTQLDTDLLDNLGQYDALLQYLGLSGSINQNLGGLFIMTAITFLASFLLLYLKRKFH